MSLGNTRRSRRAAAGLTAAAIAAGLVSLAPAAQSAGSPQPVQDHDATVFRQNGKPLTGKSSLAPAAVVRGFLKSQGVGANAVTSLEQSGGSWKTRGVTHLVMDQKVGGLRVYGSYVKAAVDGSGRLLDVVEDLAPVSGQPTKASVTASAALRAAVQSLYPGRAVNTQVAGRSGNTTQFVQGAFYSAPTAELVLVPMSDGSLAQGYLVTTWNARDNALVETVVGGDGRIVSQESRTAEDGYRIFPEDPVSTPGQVLVSNPADPVASPWGWLTGAQRTTDISGNNARAYLDADSNDVPDAGGSPVTDGVFGTVADLTRQPFEDPNRPVAVQNLFYLNNLVHDVLFKAGFTEEVGNFQNRNSSPVGNAGDAVRAEAQDGGGLDNANFATPVDGKAPRMQMYLWSVPDLYSVVVPGMPSASTTETAPAEFGASLIKTSVTAPLTVANDGTGTVTDGCEPLGGSVSGKIVVVDRGSCTFVAKAQNAQAAGAKGILVAALQTAPEPVTMGGDDPSLTLGALMVSYQAGVELKKAAGQTATMRLTEGVLLRDGDLDSDIVYHEYGHGLTWRMITHMDGPMAGAIGEGMSDVLAMIMNGDPVIGEYSSSSPGGIRTAPYDDYDRTYGDLNTDASGNEVHEDGEVYGAIGWELLQQYEAAGLSSRTLLADLVDGMNYTQPWPAYEDMRDGILAGLASSGNASRSCLVWDAFATYGVGVGADGQVVGGPVAGPLASGKRMVVRESFTRPASCS